MPIYFHGNSIQFLFKIFKLTCLGNKFSKSNLPSGIHLFKRKKVKKVYFLNLTIKSPERPCWCHSPVFIGSPIQVLQIAIPHCICLEQNYIEKRP